MDDKIRKALESLISYAHEFEDTDEYARDDQDKIIREGTILEDADVVQEWLKVSDARKYHLVSINMSSIVMRATVTKEEQLEQAVNAIQSPYNLYVIEVDPTGEIEIQPL